MSHKIAVKTHYEKGVAQMLEEFERLMQQINDIKAVIACLADAVERK